MKIQHHLLIWVFIAGLLTALFGRTLNGYITAFYFTTMLLPVVMSTTYFFNLILVPQYLLTKKYWKFGIYLVYTLIISLFLEMLVITFSFIILANYQYDNLSPIFYDVFLLAIILYFIVFLHSFIHLIIQYNSKQKEMSTLQDQQEKWERGFITVRVDRKNQKVYHDEMLFVESLSDYVKINTSKYNTLITKEKISAIENLLPDNFVRVHRSFIVNSDRITSFSREEVMIGELHFPISRTYKKQTLEKLNNF